MPTAVEFMRQYRDLKVKIVVDDPINRQCREETVSVQLKKYFMMNWTEGTEQMKDFNDVISGGKKSAFYQAHKDRIKAAAMGKGAPLDYQLALEWAVLSGKVKNPTQASLQTYLDEHMGIDCSGFVTNYLCVIGKKTYSYNLLVNGSAASSYFNAANAVNDSTQVRQNDLLVWMSGNSVKTNPGHVAVVDWYTPQCLAGGNMRVVEATGADGANPKLLDSMYTVEQIIPKKGNVPMILVVKRHGQSGSRVAVIRV